jgi:hypothetical protein
MHDCPPLPTPERAPGWRAACLAYREKRRAGKTDLEASRAAVAALQAACPLPDKKAAQEAQNAIAYASVNDQEWFWSGVGERAKVCPSLDAG